MKAFPNKPVSLTLSRNITSKLIEEVLLTFVVSKPLRCTVVDPPTQQTTEAPSAGPKISETTASAMNKIAEGITSTTKLAANTVYLGTSIH
jgi:hypothetical protein